MPIDAKAVKWDAPQAINPAVVQWDDAQYSPVDDMSTTERVLAATGSGIASVGRAVGLGSVLSRYGLPGTKEEADAIDAPLLRTTAGKVGRVLGQAAAAAPAMLIPGANTYAGAALIGAGTGAVTTEGGLSDRLEGGAYGAIGGAAGKAIGDAVGFGARKIGEVARNRASQQAASNAARDAAVQSGRQAGYVVTPAMSSKPGIIGSAAEAVGGKIKTQQLASLRNQEVTNELARKAVGLAPGERISGDALKRVRANAGTAYDIIRNAGTVQADQDFKNALGQITKQYRSAGNSFPGLVKGNPVQEIVDSLNVPKFEASDAVDAVKLLRDGADDAYRQGNKQLGKAAKSAADAIEDVLDRHAKSSGMEPDVLKAFKQARQTIAKTYTIQGALNEGSGNVIGSKLARDLSKGRPLSGELRTAAEFAQAFPKAAQEGVSVPNFSILDAAVGGAGLGSGNIPAIALPLLRPGARALSLSEVIQGGLANPSYSPGVLSRSAPALLDNELSRLLSRSAGAGLAINSAQQ